MIRILLDLTDMYPPELLKVIFSTLLNMKWSKTQIQTREIITPKILNLKKISALDKGVAVRI